MKACGAARSAGVARPGGSWCVCHILPDLAPGAGVVPCRMRRDVVPLIKSRRQTAGAGSRPCKGVERGHEHGVCATSYLTCGPSGWHPSAPGCHVKTSPIARNWKLRYWRRYSTPDVERGSVPNGSQGCIICEGVLFPCRQKLVAYQAAEILFRRGNFCSEKGTSPLTHPEKMLGSRSMRSSFLAQDPETIISAACYFIPSWITIFSRSSRLLFSSKMINLFLMATIPNSWCPEHNNLCSSFISTNLISESGNASSKVLNKTGRSIVNIDLLSKYRTVTTFILLSFVNKPAHIICEIC